MTAKLVGSHRFRRCDVWIDNNTATACMCVWLCLCCVYVYAYICIYILKTKNKKQKKTCDPWVGRKQQHSPHSPLRPGLALTLYVTSAFLRGGSCFASICCHLQADGGRAVYGRETRIPPHIRVLILLHIDRSSCRADKKVILRTRNAHRNRVWILGHTAVPSAMPDRC